MRSFSTPAKNLLNKLVGLLALLCVLVPAYSQPPPDLIFFEETSGLGSAVDVVNAGDGSNRLFIVDKAGYVRIFSGGVLQPGYFLEIPDSVSAGGERGLLSLAFHPQYAANRYFFIYYTNTAGDIRITRFQTQAGNPNAADESTGQVILTIAHPTFANHNGGKIIFGPDGMFYFGTGDGGSGGDPGNNAQNGNSLLGKMMRLNVDNFTTAPYYEIPPDNPYVANPLVRDEIFAMGLRNPWRWSFDRLNGDMWIADVGQNAWEEINHRSFLSSGGINYGWRCYEGTAPFNTAGCQEQALYISPVYSYPHNFATGGYSITGGYVYRGAEFPALNGFYICADHVSANVFLVKYDGVGGYTFYMQNGLPGSITGFGEAENGALYAVSLNGRLYKVLDGSPQPTTLLQFTAKTTGSVNELKWKTTNEQHMAFYEVEYSFNGTTYQFAAKLPAINGSGENNYHVDHTINWSGNMFYRLKITDIGGRITYSGVLVVSKKPGRTLQIYPMPVRGDRTTIVSGQPIEQVNIYTTDGRRVFTNKMNNVSGTINMQIPRLQHGVYIMQFKINNELVNEKIVIQH